VRPAAAIPLQSAGEVQPEMPPITVADPVRPAESRQPREAAVSEAGAGTTTVQPGVSAQEQYARLLAAKQRARKRQE
jgi:hypothetical protein